MATQWAEGPTAVRVLVPRSVDERETCDEQIRRATVGGLVLILMEFGTKKSLTALRSHTLPVSIFQRVQTSHSRRPHPVARGLPPGLNPAGAGTAPT